MWMLVVIPISTAFVAGVLCGPRIRMWINGAEAEAASLRNRARQIEIALHLRKE